TTVRDHSGGDPLAGVSVEFVPANMGFGMFIDPNDPMQIPPATSLSDGTCMFERVPPGNYTLRATKPPFLTPEAIDLIVPEGGIPVPPLEIVLLRGASIYGTITGEDKLPLQGATLGVAVQTPNADGWTPGPKTVSDASGAYRLEGLPA